MPEDLPCYPDASLLVEFEEGDKHFRLHPDALVAWMRMRSKAEEEGITLVLVSAFRSIARQSEIIEAKRQKGLADQEIFRVNTPPGYSEHHTGKAIDIGSPGYPCLEEEFDQSPAFQWLKANAGDAGFHMSYPPDNPYGLAYEPWHWCFRI